MKFICKTIHHVSNIVIFTFIVFIVVSCGNELLEPADSGNDKTIKSKIDSLDKLAYKYTYINIDTAILYADSALALSKEINYKKGIAKALKNKGSIGKNNGDENAEKYLLETIKIGEELCDTPLVSSTYSILGQLYQRRDGNRRDEASQAYFQCLTLAEKIGHKELMATALNDLGFLDAELGNYNKALEYFQKALNLYKEIDMQSGVAVELNSFAWVYSEQGKPEEAIEYYKKAIVIAKAINNKRYEAAFINNIAIEYDDAGKKDSALVYYEQAAKQFREMNDLYGIALVAGNIASIYQDKKQINQALKTTETFMEAAKKANAKDEIMRSHKIMSEVQALNKNFEKAYSHRITYDQLHDSIFNEENSAIISELRLKYEAEKKDMELLKKENKISRQKQLVRAFVLIAFIFFISALTVAFFYRQKQKAYKHLLISYEKQMICMNDKIGSLKRIKLDDSEKEKLIHLINKKLIDEKVFCTQGIDINQCASLLNTNRSYLSSVINDVFKKSFPDFINELRINEACEKLKDEDSKIHTLEAISESVGFSSRNTFTRNFKKATGVTPSFYVNNHLKLN